MPRRADSVTAVQTGTLALRRDPDAPNAWFVDLDDRRQSHVDLDEPTRLALGYVRRMGHVIDLLPPAGAPLDVVHLGGGGLTLARYVAVTRPRSRQRVFEIDGRLTDHVRTALPLDPSWRIRVRAIDALEGMRALRSASTDLLINDVYRDGYTPGHLTTTEFAEQLRRVLRPDGAYLANLLEPLLAQRAIKDLRAAGRKTVAAILDKGRRSSGGNVVVIGTNAVVDLAALRARLAADARPGRVVTGA